MDLIYRTGIARYDPRGYHAGQREYQLFRSFDRENAARYR